MPEINKINRSKNIKQVSRIDELKPSEEKPYTDEQIANIPVLKKNKVNNFNAKDLTMKEVKLILTERCFDIEELNVY